MLKIDERSDDQERNKNPIRNRHLPRKCLPNSKEQNRGDQFDCEIAKRNLCPTMCASTAKNQPTDQRKIVMPGNRLFALRTKRAARLIDREIDRPTVDANVQKRSDRCTEYECKCAEEQILSRMLHAISWRSVSRRAAPSSRRSRCSFRITDTLAEPWRPGLIYQEWA